MLCMFMPQIIFLISISLLYVREKTNFSLFYSYILLYILNTWMIVKNIDCCEDSICYTSRD